jgi:hypothetical protein
MGQNQSLGSSVVSKSVSPNDAAMQAALAVKQAQMQIYNNSSGLKSVSPQGINNNNSFGGIGSSIVSNASPVNAAAMQAALAVKQAQMQIYNNSSGLKSVSSVSPLGINNIGFGLKSVSSVSPLGINNSIGSSVALASQQIQSLSNNMTKPEINQSTGLLISAQKAGDALIKLEKLMKACDQMELAKQKEIYLQLNGIAQLETKKLALYSQSLAEKQDSLFTKYKEQQKTVEKFKSQHRSKKSSRSSNYNFSIIIIIIIIGFIIVKNNK